MRHKNAGSKFCFWKKLSKRWSWPSFLGFTSVVIKQKENENKKQIWQKLHTIWTKRTDDHFSFLNLLRVFLFSTHTLNLSFYPNWPMVSQIWTMTCPFESFNFFLWFLLRNWIQRRIRSVSGLFIRSFNARRNSGVYTCICIQLGSFFDFFFYSFHTLHSIWHSHSSNILKAICHTHTHGPIVLALLLVVHYLSSQWSPLDILPTTTLLTSRRDERGEEEFTE